MSKKGKILVAIADDHTLLRNGLAELIDNFGPFKVVIEAENGRELLDHIAGAAVLPDICILDITMPVLDGFGALTELKQKWPEIKVLALSMYNNESTIIRMLRSGANGYLLKNCDPLEFKNALQIIYDQGFYESESIDKPTEEPVSITPKEIEFLKWCCSELVYKEIADKMGIKPRSVEDHRDNLFRKLKINTRTGLVVYALRSGLVPL